MTVQEKVINSLMQWRLWIVPSVISLLLIILAQLSYFAFHTLIQFFTIIITLIMFTLAWFTRGYSKNSFLFFLACGYLWVGSFDLIHALFHKGIAGGGNQSIQFWIAGRYLETLLLLAAPLLAAKKQNEYLLITLWGSLAVALSGLILLGAFPITFIEGQGASRFTEYSEYLIIFFLLTALCSFLFTGAGISAKERKLIIAAIAMSICAELAFTYYLHFSGQLNILGHILKAFSFWLVFNAIISATLKKPYAALQKSEESYKRLFDNSEISIWNEDLSEVNETLNKLRNGGVTDLGQYLQENEHVAWTLAAMVKVRQVNEATLKLFRAKSRGDFFRRISDTFGENAIDVFVKGLHAIWEKNSEFRAEANYRTLDGQEINCIISFPIPETQSGFQSIPVTLVDITHRKQNEVRIWRQGNFDSLTGLVNRNLFSDRLSHALDSAKRNKTRLALLYLDLDGFKYVNDTLGHLLGDQLLQEASQRLLSHMRKSDTVARLGGDEFAILLPENNSNHDIASVVKKIQLNLAQPYRLQGRDCFVSASIGITLFPDDGNDAVTLLRKADSAMYRAKAKGRNNFLFFTPDIEEQAIYRTELEESLYSALKNERFSLKYQPIINKKTGKIKSAEALIRWNHPEKGEVSPMAFIPLAEEIGLIGPIGEWVLREACAEAMTWPITDKQAPDVAVNVSSHQFQRQNIPKLVESVLQDTGLAAERLTLEITESLLLADNDRTLNQLQELRNLGVQLSIDDFGTGYSSLSYLKKFPVTTLKIDRSFIMNLPAACEDGVLINAILAMAKSLGINVVAEGVETEAQETFLKSTTCQYLQGYRYSRPLTNTDFLDYLKTHAGSERNLQRVRESA